MGRAPGSGGTEEHPGPDLGDAPRGAPALLVAFPGPIVLDLPRSGEPVGRDWFERHGLADNRISTAHLLFTRAGGAVSVEDAGSRNGTWLDGQRLGPGARARLTDGAMLRLGRTIIVYRDELLGARMPMPPRGPLVGPFGLRAVSETLDGLARRPPRCVLIEGETGTGKELVAGAIAEAVRPGRPYVAVNVAGIPAGVFESQLFGHVAGAYSGAGKGARGIIAAHDGGVVFFDEIGELPPELQPKLLRFLENGELFPVGADRPSRADVVVVAATNRSVDRMVAEGAFRRDIYARLAVATLELPPLRERREDLFAIACAFALRRGEKYDVAAVDVEAVERLMLHDFPNNMRELYAVLERVAAADPPPALRMAAVSRVLGAPVSQRREPLTRERVDAALRANHGNQSQAARELGVSRGQLLRYLKSVE